jgi:proton glutamate symport protein
MISSFIQRPLYQQIFVAILLALAVGIGIQLTVAEETIPQVVAGFDFFGSLFIQALKMLIVPLITSAIISAMANIGQEKGFGRLAWKTLAYYITTSLLAIIVGLILVNWIAPGIIDGRPASEVIELPSSDEATLSKAEGRGAGDVIDVFKRMVPPNVLKAAVEGQMLGLICFSILFGFFLSRVNGSPGESLKNFWLGLYEVMLKITDLIMRFAPIGVFALIASISAQVDLRDILRLAWFPVTVLAALGVHLFITLPLMLIFLGKVSPVKHYRAMFSAMLTAFSTASSSATLPITMECLTDRAGVSKRVTSFTTPLGATVNMDGTALYECVAVIFLMQAFGMEISITAQVTTVLLALLTSIGVAGIPAASLVAILIILNAVGLPEELIGVGIALLQFTDRILDMCRTAINVTGDSTCAAVIARTEGEETKVGL